MATFGHLLTGFSLVLFFYSFVMSFVGIKNGVAFLKKTSLLAYYGGALLLTAASFVLVLSLLLDNFALEYVFLNSARNIHWIYKMAAFYVGKEGSLLFWALTLSLTSSLFFRRLFKKCSAAGFELTAVSIVQVFLGAVLFFSNSPFKESGFIPSDGRGLNPVLENPFMVIHPPFILLGYMIFTIPFALAVVSLIKRDYSGTWIDRARPWLLWGFVFLGLGTALGAYWAYIEFGWGGYWSWDPVENSSLIPWLLSVALIHSVMIEKNLKMNKKWNYVLAFSVFISTLLSVFITRSGVVASVHSYAGSNVGWYFLLFMIVATLLCAFLLFSRRKSIVSGKLKFLTSKEALFSALNIVLVVFVLAVLIGTFFPVLTDLFWGKKIVVGHSYYNRILSFLGPLLLLGLGINPLLRYGRSFELFSPKVLWYLFFVVLGGFASLFLRPIRTVSIVSLSLSFGALFTVLSDAAGFLRSKRDGTRPRSKALSGTVAHLGIILMALGITGSAHKTQVQKDLKTGEKFAYSGYEIVFKGLETREDSRKGIVFSVLDLVKGGKYAATLRPAKFFFGPVHPNMRPRVTAESDTYTGLKNGLVFVMEDFDLKKGRADIIVTRNPLIFFLWLGLALLFAGGLLSICEKMRRSKTT